MSIEIGLDVFEVASKIGWSMFSESIAMGFDSPSNGSLNLALGGCMIPGNYLDCEMACSNNAYLFQDGLTLANCLRLAGLALILQSTNATVDTQSLEQVEKFYRLGDLSKFNGTEVLSSFLTCVATSCDLGPEESCTPELSGLQDIRITNDTIPTIVDGVGSYCNVSQIAANGDIAGPGVVVSYMIQSLLAMIFWSMVKFFVSWPKRLVAYTTYLFIDAQKDREARVEKARRYQALLSNSRPGVAFLSVFAEFQEAQIFFLAAVQVATYSMLYTRDGIPRDDGSWAQMRLDSLLARSLAVVGTSPVLIAQAGLQHADYHWWYLHIGTIIVSTMSVIVTFYAPFMKNTPEVFQQDFLPSCGNNVSPLKFCVSEVNEFHFNDGLFGTERLTTTYHLPMIALLLADQIIWLFANRVQRNLLSQTATFRGKQLLSSIWKGTVTLVWCGIVVFQFLLLVAIGRNIQYLRDTLKLYSEGISLRTWSFGQLIAVLIWAPMVSKYIYYNIFGLEAGLEERISRAYEIVRKPDVSESEVKSRLEAEEHKSHSANTPPKTESFITRQATEPQLEGRSSLV